MDEELIRKIRSEFARSGGQARAKAMTAAERRKSAIKASRAAANENCGSQSQESAQQETWRLIEPVAAEETIEFILDTQAGNDEAIATVQSDLQNGSWDNALDGDFNLVGL